MTQPKKQKNMKWRNATKETEIYQMTQPKKTDVLDDATCDSP